MQDLVLLCLAAMAFMVCQDTFATGMVVAESQNLPKWAGRLDAANDYASKYGGAVVTAMVVKYDLWSWQTFVLVSCVAATSYVTTNFTTQAAHRLAGRIKAKGAK